MSGPVQVTPDRAYLVVPTSLGDICVTVEYAVVRNTLIIGQPSVEVDKRPGVDVVILPTTTGRSWREVADIG